MLGRTEYTVMAESACGHLVPIGSHTECSDARR